MLWLAGALGVVVGGLGLWLARQGGRLRGRVTALQSDALEPLSVFPSVLSIEARHLRTVFSAEVTDPLLPGFLPGQRLRLEVSDGEIVLRADGSTAWIPLVRVAEVLLVASFESSRSASGAAILRVDWRRGGERLSSAFEVASWMEAEKLRREVHLRAAQARGGGT